MARSLELMLWSTRISSSRQCVGSLGDALYKAAPATPPFGGGIRASNACPTGLTGTWLPVNGRPAFGLGTPLINAGCTGQSEPGHKSLKFPMRSVADGTRMLNTPPGPGTRSRRHSCDQKKKVFCLSEIG